MRELVALEEVGPWCELDGHGAIVAARRIGAYVQTSQV
jgi:hypothetical protein